MNQTYTDFIKNKPVETVFRIHAILLSIFAIQKLLSKKVDKHTLQIIRKTNYRMHKIGKALLLLCSLTSAGEIAAQTVSGKLIDENKQPLPYANVVLLTLPDSTFVTGTVTAEDGTFSLNTTTPNQLVRISSIGYNTVYKPVQPANLGVMQLTSDTQQ